MPAVVGGVSAGFIPSPNHEGAVPDANLWRATLQRYGFITVFAALITALLSLQAGGLSWFGSDLFIAEAIPLAAIGVLLYLYITIRWGGPTTYSVDDDGLMLWFPGLPPGGSRSVLTPWTAIVGSSPAGLRNRDRWLLVQFPAVATGDMAPFVGRRVSVRVSADAWDKISEHLPPTPPERAT